MICTGSGGSAPRFAGRLDDMTMSKSLLESPSATLRRAGGATVATAGRVTDELGRHRQELLFLLGTLVFAAVVALLALAVLIG